MKIVRGLALCLLVVWADCAGLLAEPRSPIIIGVVWWPARYALDSAWRADTVREAAWCVTDYTTFHYPDASRADSILRVYRVAPAAMTRRAPTGVDFPPCPGNEPELHTHPPQDGVTTCDPTRIDRETLAHRRKPFGVIQCGARSFRFYWPDEETP